MAVKKLTREAVLAADDRQVELFEVPEWGGSVPLRAPDAWQLSEYNSSIIDINADGDGGFATVPKLEGADVKLAAIGIADADGPWFTVEELKHKSAGAVSRIAKRLREMSNMGKDALEEAKGN
ncbi:MAG: hypothetical protein ACPGIJ_09705 [Mycobacterium sp.]